MTKPVMHRPTFLEFQTLRNARTNPRRRRAGVEFIPENGGGPGVRLRKVNC
jgi:hypothetical protein